MERPMKGDVVVIPFPFSDVSRTKKRPALVIAEPFGEDVLLSQITTRANENNFSIKLDNNDFYSGNLPHSSSVKINRLFSADVNIIEYTAGTLKREKVKNIENSLIDFIRRNNHS